MPTGSLSGEGKTLWEKIHSASLKAGDSEEVAAKKAWAGVKNAGWHKTGDKWEKKSTALAEFSMYFSKVGTNTKKWSMTASDTLLDLRDEAMSLELYKSFIDNIETDSPIPSQFAPLVTDSFWNGGMPYLSIAHYPALDGDGVPGDVHAVYVDGNQLKAKGVFNDTPLGLATWKSILADKQGTAGFENKARVSIGFLDLSHKHGDFVFERKSLEDRCPMCDEGVGNKVYLKGYLVHLAMTRVPVNPRSEVEVDLSMTTRKEDAESIVGEELATELAEKQKAIVGKSDILVERADDEVEAPVDTVSTEEQPVEETPTEPVAASTATDELTLRDIMLAINEMRSKSNPEVVERSLVEQKFDGLMEVMKSAIAKPITVDEKLQEIQPALNDFATSIQEEVNKSSVVVDAVTSQVNENDVEGVISKAIQPLLEQMSLFSTRLDQMAAIPITERRVPQPRGISPIAVKSLVKTEQKQLSPIEKIAAQSVGLNVE